MEVLPVLDLLNGIVVRGIAGRRSEYQPIRSILTTSHHPLDIAESLRVCFGFQRFYVADLDAIIRGRPNWNLYAQLIDAGYQLLIDAGIKDPASAMRIRTAGAEPIVGLESCANPQALAEVVACTSGELTFSLDLLGGQPQFAPLTKDPSREQPHESAAGTGQRLEIVWETGWDNSPQEIARQAIRCGVRRMIVLDLADVGTSSGGRTDALCQSILKEFPNLRLICGGGVRGIGDLLRFKSIGASDVLVASALHDGRLTRLDLDRLRSVKSQGTE